MRNLLKLFRCRGWRQDLLAGITGLLLGSLSGCAIILWSHNTDPVVVHEVHELDGSAPRNGHLDLYVDLDRTRDCPSETSRWLWTWVEHDGQRLKQFYPLVNTTTTLSDLGHDQHFILSIPVPPGVWPGEWFYCSKTIEHSPLLPNLIHSMIRESLDIPVHITGDNQ